MDGIGLKGGECGLSDYPGHPRCSGLQDRAEVPVSGPSVFNAGCPAHHPKWPAGELRRRCTDSPFDPNATLVMHRAHR
jgi:hypothetical protein